MVAAVAPEPDSPDHVRTVKVKALRVDDNRPEEFASAMSPTFVDDIDLSRAQRAMMYAVILLPIATFLGIYSAMGEGIAAASATSASSETAVPETSETDDPEGDPTADPAATVARRVGAELRHVGRGPAARVRVQSTRRGARHRARAVARNQGSARDARG